MLTWFHPFHTVLDADFHEVDFAWFVGGRLNACYNCVDRHLADARRQDRDHLGRGRAGRVRAHHLPRAQARGGPGRQRAARARRASKGDRVCIYLPMIPELAYAMLACARIGAVHSVVFAGFSAECLRDRILDAGCKLVITANEGLRGGKQHPAQGDRRRGDRRPRVRRARAGGAPHRRRGADARGPRPLARRRDARASAPTCPTEWMSAEDPLYILYTSGSTGKPKGVLHTTGGYLLYAALTHKLVFDLHDGRRLLLRRRRRLGHRPQLHRLRAARQRRHHGDVRVDAALPRRRALLADGRRPRRHHLLHRAHRAPRHRARRRRAGSRSTRAESLRILGTVGEPINPEVWRWYHDVVGDGRCAVVDTWWQTETGGILITPLPGATPTKPGSATLPFFGVEPVLVDDEGKVLDGNGVDGQPLPAPPVAGPGAHHLRRPPALPRDLLLALPRPLLHRRRLPARRGRLLLDHRPRRRRAQRLRPPPRHRRDRERARRPRRGGRGGGGRLPARHQGHRHLRLRDLQAGGGRVGRRGAGRARSRSRCATPSAPSPRPTASRSTPGLPKTRSGKIMRRILRKIAAGEYEELGDITTLAEPAVVEKLVDAHRAGARA